MVRKTGSTSVLEQQAADWQKAANIRSFLHVVEQVLVGQGTNPILAAWLGWARQIASRLDPLSDPPSVPRPVAPA